MQDDADANQNDGTTRLYDELQQLFEEAQDLHTQSMYLLAVARRMHVETAPTPQPAATAAAPAELSPEETLDRIVALLAAFPFETQVAITKALALGMVSVARSRLAVKRPPAA